MSHYSHINTKIQNINYLKKALTNLKITYVDKNNFTETSLFDESQNVNIIIPQNNGYDLEFLWNGKEYELVTDLSFWQQKWSVTTFVDNIAKNYASETILGESLKQGFQKTESINNIDGSTTLVLERWK
tara:strand:- start:1010 stop:1396 length:387 start_codon:yes stop_codon:yes gene_type:complete